MALQHNASLVMTRLAFRHSIIFDDVLAFLTRNLDKASTHIAVNYSTVNEKTNHIEICQMEDIDLDEGDLRNKTEIDMSIFDKEEKSSVDRGSGLVYGLDDATDVGSMDTNMFMNKKKSSKAAMGHAEMMRQSSKHSDIDFGDDYEVDDGTSDAHMNKHSGAQTTILQHISSLKLKATALILAPPPRSLRFAACGSFRTVPSRR